MYFDERRWKENGKGESPWDGNESERFIPENVDQKETLRAARRQWLKQQWAEIADRYRDKLVELYGEQKGKQVRYAEAFQVTELRRPLTPEQFRYLFPFLAKTNRFPNKSP